MLQSECNGEYDLAPELVNGCPHWASKNNSRFVYWHNTGRWVVTDSKTSIAEGAYAIYSSKAARQTLPDDAKLRWYISADEGTKKPHPTATVTKVGIRS